MKLTPVLKIYLFLLALFLVALAFLANFHMRLNSTRAQVEGLEKELVTITAVAQRIHEQQCEVNHLRQTLGQGALDMNRVLEEMKKHGLKDPTHSGTSQPVKHKTYMEELFKVSIKEEKLKDIVSFLLDVERINAKRIKVKDLNFSRNAKDKDLWTAEVTLAQISPKSP